MNIKKENFEIVDDIIGVFIWWGKVGRG